MAIIKTLTEGDNSIKYFADKIKQLFVRKDGNKQLSDENYSTEEKNKLASLNNYTLPVADESTLGGIKIGAGINRTSDGTISVTLGSGGGSTSNFTMTKKSLSFNLSEYEGNLFEYECSGITLDNIVIVSPKPNYIKRYAELELMVTGQNTNNLIFSKKEGYFTENMEINVLIIDIQS